MNPRILLSGCNERRVLYETAITQAGGIVSSYHCPPLDDSYDGLLLCGGNDIDPRFYGEENTACKALDPQRDEIEIQLVKLYAAAGKPILGICRGMQILNVALGGSMIQDIGPRQLIFHGPWDGPNDKVHPICVEDGSILGALYGERPMVNSVHHQAVNRLGEGLKAVAWSESGIVEALEHEQLPILGLQFHPERMSFLRRRPDTVDGAPVFHWFISAAGKSDKNW